ncbi:saccharopine dehydrogenase NADP-binding domain-containing protein [Marinicella litoralis]|uniref:Saccharopine dehydrogenase-like protein n=1 Tax=Marinicella litoralis TaxID=644220 RepID=A0A4R6XVK1_9GAMM|nr:saccharopine dehydrogenase NADP-binding domain-containing protein [Marinicella litoralis]TDR23866.1 saccharopine dehydrogenase-like protein [Marinicella litoralis]
MKQTNKQQRILVLGGYGTFGRRIVKALCSKGFTLFVNGRNKTKAQVLLENILKQQPDAKVMDACFDVFVELKTHLEKIKPDLVIHCCGPFQDQDTAIAQTIITAGIHYIDLADGRAYCQNILKLNSLAEQNQVTAITGASTVPTLSSAVLLHLQKTFHIKSFESVRIGISPGQKTSRGLATTQAVLSYVGQPLKPWPGLNKTKFGWQDTYLQPYPGIKNRLMGNCEAADLDLLHQHFPINKLSFSAGMESKLLHGLIWFCSWMVRLGLPLKLADHGARLLSVSRWFDFLGGHDGGMHVEIKALDHHGTHISKTWYVIAKHNDGPQIPSIPAIILAEKILNQNLATGARSSVNQVSLTEYSDAFQGLAIQTLIL